MKIWLIIIGLFVSAVVYSSVTSMHGITGLTRLNGEGCVCHNFTSSGTVNVSITGPDSVLAGSIVQYTVKMTGSPGVVGGLNVAARNGSLSPFDTTSRVIDGELTHSKPKAFSNDTVTWKFSYQAPTSLGWDTLYAVGLSANQDSIPTSEDKWNFSPNFPVKVVSFIPVELSSFTTYLSRSEVIVSWITSSETNNKGFNLYRIFDSKEELLGFVQGNGTSLETNRYQFNDSPSREGSYCYRLEQIDFNGASRSYMSNEIFFTGAADFHLLKNYPNPFNPATTISFSSSVGGQVRIDIYNAAGEFVSSAANSFFPAGNHKIAWNAGSLPTGIYFCRLNIEAATSAPVSKTIKMVLAK